jgi:cell division transport system permease protein
MAELHTDVQLTVYLKGGVSPAEAEAVRGVVSQRSGAPARLIAPTEALARLARELGPSAETLATLPENPLPYSVEVQLPKDRQGQGALTQLAAQVRALPEVELVDYGEEAVARLSRLSAALKLGGLIAFILLGVATVVTVAATFQLAIYARRTEVEIQKLVGATDGFVRAPFLLEGAFQGMLAAGLAALALWGGLRGAQDVVAELLGFLGLPTSAAPRLTVALGVELGVAGIVLGLFGSGVAVRRFLRA